MSHFVKHDARGNVSVVGGVTSDLDAVGEAGV